MKLIFEKEIREMKHSKIKEKYLIQMGRNNTNFTLVFMVIVFKDMKDP